MHNLIVWDLMRKLSNTLFNASQGETYSKDDVLNVVKYVLEEYNRHAQPDCKVDIRDFR